jgi:hypothetical protein
MVPGFEVIYSQDKLDYQVRLELTKRGFADLRLDRFGI